MRRREFLSVLGSAAASWPLAARAQQGERVRRIGVLSNIAEDDPAMKARFGAFRQGLEKLGWSEGRNVSIDTRFGAVGAEQVQARAKELFSLQPDVILANAPPVIRVLQQMKPTIPIVFVAVSDPIGAGLIANLPRPGGNFTGLQNFEASITGKWLAMLKEIEPRLTRAAIVGNPQTTDFDYFLRASKAEAPSLAIDIVPVGAESAADIERGITPSRAWRTAAWCFHQMARPSCIAISLLPWRPGTACLVYALRFFVEAGGLMSYSTDLNDQYRQAANYVDRILRGDKPADLSVQTPTKFETVINLKTARALGLTVPPGLLVAADEVIE